MLVGDPSTGAPAKSTQGYIMYVKLPTNLPVASVFAAVGPQEARECPGPDFKSRSFCWHMQKLETVAGHNLLGNRQTERRATTLQLMMRVTTRESNGSLRRSRPNCPCSTVVEKRGRKGGKGLRHYIRRPAILAD